MDDEQIKRILTTARTIAAVGVSPDADKPSHTVPLYLQAKGYRIIPVNPNVENVLGEMSYPDLLSVPGEIDVVQIFRPSDEVPPVVEQAIQKGAKVVWMQQGISNLAAARRAEAAGLQVVMDRCMRTEHRRLIAKPT